MKKYIFIIISIIYTFNLLADTIVPAGRIIDHWTKSNSPYRINGNIYIDYLIIDAGVEVLFDNNHLFQVDSILICNGFYNDSIVFKSNPNNPNGWDGIAFKNCTIS